MVLRLEVGSAGSDLRWRRAPGLGNAAGMENDAKSVVLEAGETMSARLTFLHTG